METNQGHHCYILRYFLIAVFHVLKYVSTYILESTYICICIYMHICTILQRTGNKKSIE